MDDIEKPTCTGYIVPALVGPRVASPPQLFLAYSAWERGYPRVDLYSLIPRLLPSFLSSMRQKAGEEPGNEARLVPKSFTSAHCVLFLSLQLERQLQMQMQMRQRMIATQLAMARERMYWWEGFTSLVTLGLIVG